MKTMLILMLLLVSSFSMADSGQSPDDILLFQHWEGPKSLISALDKNQTDKCEYLESRVVKFSNVKFAVQRILITMEGLSCEKKSHYVLKFINDQDVVMQIAAVNLARTLSVSGKKAVNDKILKLRNKDPDLDIAISEFIKSSRTQ